MNEKQEKLLMYELAGIREGIALLTLVNLSILAKTSPLEALDLTKDFIQSQARHEHRLQGLSND